MDALVSPHSKALAQATAQLYDVFDATQVMADIDVCTCDCCVFAPETYQQMKTTPAKDWPVDLIVQYSNSAHGVPKNQDHLRALFPRYLEIIESDEMVDIAGFGTELLRFGDAWRNDADFLTVVQQQVLGAWLGIAMDHFIWLDGTEDGATYTAEHLVEMFLIGGWPVAHLRRLVEERLHQPAFIAGFACWLTNFDRPKANGFRPDIFGLQYLNTAQFNGFFAWLNDPSFADQFIDFATGPDNEDQTLYFGQVAARRFVAISGQYAP